MIWQAFISRASADAAKDAANAATLAAKTAQDTLAETQASDSRQAALAAQAREESIKEATNASLQASRALQATIDNFHLEQRAYLVPTEPPTGPLNDGIGLLRIPIRNYGHVSARNATLFINYRVNSQGDPMPLVDHRQFTTEAAAEIPPGDTPTYQWSIFLPGYGPEGNALLTSGNEFVHVDGELSYDTGFGKRDSIAVCYLFQTVRNRWEGCSQTQHVWMNDVPGTRR